MRILRPLSRPLFGELRLKKDVAETIANDILVVSPLPCEGVRKSADCLCQRAFIGSNSGRVSTLAITCEEDEGDAYESFVHSPLARHWWGENSAPLAAGHLWRMSDTLHRFQPGDIIRVRWHAEKGAGLYLNDLNDDEIPPLDAAGASEQEDSSDQRARWLEE
ncbi:MAG: hypothetical protein PWP23_1857 [Candidatus Sumerlaeota bacterium]|nr:hypothetical protein [Candidatus Sumerlaeota bacterium]